MTTTGVAVGVDAEAHLKKSSRSFTFIIMQTDPIHSPTLEKQNNSKLSIYRDLE